MAEYINREKTKRELSEWCISLNRPHLLSRDDTMFLLDNIPAADVAPVVHGQWLFDFSLSDSVFYRCSICNRQEVLLRKYSIEEQCPYCHCGARMDGDSDALD